MVEEEDTDEEEEGSDEDSGRERDARPADEDKHGGEARDLGESSGGRGLVVGIDKALLRAAPCGVEGLEAGGGLV